MGDTGLILAHAALGVVSLNSLSNGFSRNGLVHPGMHVNLLVHAVLGGLKASGSGGGDIENILKISMACTKYLPLPCLMVDLYEGYNENADIIRAAHILSGLIPLFLTLSGKENVELGKACIAANILSVCYLGYNRSGNDWIWFTAGSGVLAYFLAEGIGPAAYPIGLALMEFCACKAFWGGGSGGSGGGDLKKLLRISRACSKYLPLPCLMADLYQGFNENADMIRTAHILSGLIPLFMALSGKENGELGKICIAANIMSLCYFGCNRSGNDWIWYIAGSGIMAYFLADIGAPAYPIGLALMEFCTCKAFVS